MKWLVSTFFAAFALCLTAHAAVDSQSTKLTIYSVWLSPNADCSEAVQVSDTSAGTEVDISQSPTLGSGMVASGTYKCLILGVNSVMKFTPAANQGLSCTGGHEETYNICITPNSVNTSKDPANGATINCTGTDVHDATGDHVFIYVSTNSACSGTLSTDPACGGIFTNAFVPPTVAADVDHGFKLDNDIVISGDTSATFVFNTDNQIQTAFDITLGANVCNMEGFNLSFR